MSQTRTSTSTSVRRTESYRAHRRTDSARGRLLAGGPQVLRLWPAQGLNNETDLKQQRLLAGAGPKTATAPASGGPVAGGDGGGQTPGTGPDWRAAAQIQHLRTSTSANERRRRPRGQEAGWAPGEAVKGASRPPDARAGRQSLALGQTSRQRAGDVEEQGGAAEGALIDREAAPKHAEPAWPSGWRARHRLRNKRRL